MCFKQTANLLSLGTHVLPPRCTFVVRSLLIISSRDCREADSHDTSPRHACLGEVSRKIWLHDFAINNNGGSVPVIFISLCPTIRISHKKFLAKNFAVVESGLFIFKLAANLLLEFVCSHVYSEHEVVNDCKSAVQFKFLQLK